MKNIAVLGSTGSIGTQTLEVAAANPERIRVVALAAHKNDQLLEAQIRKFHPVLAALSDTEAARRLKERYEGPTEILAGPEGIMAAATCSQADTVLGAMWDTRACSPPWQPSGPGRTSPWPTRRPWWPPAAW